MIPSDSKVYVLQGSEQVGPYSLYEIQEQRNDGRLGAHDWVWYEGLEDWISVSDLLKQAGLEETSDTSISTGYASTANENEDDKESEWVPPKRTGFGKYFASAWTYPFTGDGWILLVTGTLLFTVVKVFSQLSCLLALLGAVLMGGLWFSMLRQVVHSTAMGNDSPPDWPDFTEWMEDIVSPYVQWLCLTALCLGPGFTLIAMGFDEPEAFMSLDWSDTEAHYLVVGAALLLLGAFIFPMGVLAVALYDSLQALNPLFLIASIVRTLQNYLFLIAATVLLWIVGAVTGWLSSMVPFASIALQSFFSLYFVFAWARLLGGFYRVENRTLEWT